MVAGYIPKDLAEALAFRRDYGAVPLAGGTDLMVRWRSFPGTVPQFPWPILYVGGLEELKGIREEKDKLIIGAGTDLTTVMHDLRVPRLLRDAVRQMAAPALRNLATLAGNIGNASPAGDAVCVLYALDAGIELRSSDTARIVRIADFITGPGRTVLAADELITAVLLPFRKSDFSWSVSYYRKVGTRKANALSKLSAAGLMASSQGVIAAVRFALGAVGPTVVRSPELEQACAGLDRAALMNKRQELIELYSTLVVPIDDQRSTADYRRTVALNCIGEFLDLSAKELN